jgi:hypothetical protein
LISVAHYNIEIALAGIAEIIKLLNILKALSPENWQDRCLLARLDSYLHEIFLCRIEARTDGSYETQLLGIWGWICNRIKGAATGRCDCEKRTYHFLPIHPPRGEQSRAANFVYLLQLRRKGKAVNRQRAAELLKESPTELLWRGGALAARG